VYLLARYLSSKSAFIIGVKQVKPPINELTGHLEVFCYVIAGRRVNDVGKLAEIVLGHEEPSRKLVGFALMATGPSDARIAEQPIPGMHQMMG